MNCVCVCACVWACTCPHQAWLLSLRSSLVAQVASVLVLVVLERRPSVSRSLMSGRTSTSFITSLPNAVHRSLRTQGHRSTHRRAGRQQSSQSVCVLVSDVVVGLCITLSEWCMISPHRPTQSDRQTGSVTPLTATRGCSAPTHSCSF